MDAITKKAISRLKRIWEAKLNEATKNFEQLSKTKCYMWEWEDAYDKKELYMAALYALKQDCDLKTRDILKCPTCGWHHHNIHLPSLIVGLSTGFVLGLILMVI